MEICNLLDNEFKIAVLRKLVELEKKTTKTIQQNQESIHEQNEKFNKSHKKDQTNSGAAEFNE